MPKFVHETAQDFKIFQDDKKRMIEMTFFAAAAKIKGDRGPESAFGKQ